ncbi:putative nwd2 protein [Mycena venus]|uniref:Putative nwd2 protein n=1 Tax=Mycena venus TaxID=2733690 RepID=A0A8H7DDP1_9AGAR|nr:putative nwd2 protein [Mycena venus]
MPVISPSSGNRGGTSDDVEEMKLRRTPELKGQRGDLLASTQILDRNLNTNTNGSQVKPAAVSTDVPSSCWSKLLGRLHRFGKPSTSTTTTSALPASAASPPALSNMEISSFAQPSHLDPPPTVVSRHLPDDMYTSGDAVVRVDLERSRTDHHSAPGPSNSQFASKRPAFEHKSKTSININHYIYGGSGGRGGRGMQGQGGGGGVGEGPSVNYHIEAGTNINQIQRDGEPGLHILYRASAGDATHDSEDRFPQPRCHPKTRTKLLKVLSNWTKGIEPPEEWNSGRDFHFWRDDDEDDSLSSEYVSDDDDGLLSEYTSSDKPSSPILWLYGPAGAGKSAVAQSLCQQLEEEGRLGASFFFKRGHPSRGHAKRLFVTIAYQLACHLPDLNHHISHSMQNDPSLVDKSLSIQLQRSIIEPCRQMGSSSAWVVVIDGLDECDGRNIQQEILQLLGYAAHEQQLPLQFLVASRPEPHICEMFSGKLNGIHWEVNVKQAFDDVRKYLLDEFARVHLEHHETMASIPLPWPTRETVDNLVEKSSGYFIYAATAIRFIDDKDFHPIERLQVITGIKEPWPDCDSPFAALDALYTQILLAVPCRPHFTKILAVIAAKIQLAIGYIDQLLELEPGEVQLTLRGLRSVIGVKKDDDSESNDWSPESKIMVHHASFYDFLQDPTRARIFYVGSSSLQTDLCCHILKALSYSYDNPYLNKHGYTGW